MDYGESTGLWQRVDLFEQSLCLRVNRGCRYPAVRALFAVVSRLGDGVAFTLIATAHVPQLAPILVPFMLLVAASRVLLGLHYPTDVAAGAVIGALLAYASLSVWPVQVVTRP
mgnify:CR=1 FL=1